MAKASSPQLTVAGNAVDHRNTLSHQTQMVEVVTQVLGPEVELEVDSIKWTQKEKSESFPGLQASTLVIKKSHKDLDQCILTAVFGKNSKACPGIWCFSFGGELRDVLVDWSGDTGPPGARDNEKCFFVGESGAWLPWLCTCGTCRNKSI